MQYGPAIKQRILALYDQGFTTKQIADRLLICRSGCRRVKQRRHEPPRKNGGGHFKLNADNRLLLQHWVEETPDATLAELQQRIATQMQTKVSIGCLWNTLRRMKLSLKKSR